MANKFDLPAVYACIVSKVKEIIQTLHDEGISSDIQYMAWDSRGEIVELPNVDLIGVADWTWDESDHLPLIETGIILSVMNDANLFREVEILNVIRNACVNTDRNEYKVWTVRDEANEPFAQLKVTDFTILPGGESEARTVRHIGISLKRADYNG